MVDGVNIISYFGKNFGIAESSKSLVRSIQKSQIPFVLLSVDKYIPSWTAKESFDLPISEKMVYSTNLFCMDHSHVGLYVEEKGWDHFKSRHNIGFLVWETNVVPPNFRRGWRYLDEIWTTTRYIQEHLSVASSLPVHLIPQPISMPLFEKTVSKQDFNLEDKFTFLFCFDFASNLQRKNPMAIIEAFKIAFPSSNEVQLVIKSRNGDLMPYKLKEMHELIKNDPRIVWRDESTSSGQRYDLMRMCDCYVSLHRSEGFGMTLAEALLLEKPVVATGYSGNMDFTHPDNSYLCSYKLVRIGEGYYPYPKEGIWAEVDVEEAAYWMKYVFEHPIEAKGKALKGKEYILKNHSFEALGKKIKKRLDAIEISPKIKPMPFIYLNSRVKKLYRAFKQKIKKILIKQ